MWAGFWRVCRSSQWHAGNSSDSEVHGGPLVPTHCSLGPTCPHTAHSLLLQGPKRHNPRGLETVSGHFAEGLKSKKNGCVRSQRALASYQPWDLSYMPRSGSIRF